VCIVQIVKVYASVEEGLAGDQSNSGVVETRHNTSDVLWAISVKKSGIFETIQMNIVPEESKLRKWQNAP
jgi:hypothetical protein